MGFGVEGLRVLVTASTRGIGRGVAEVLLENGARVVVNGRREDRLKKTVEELRELGEVYGVRGDISIREEAISVVEEAAKILGGLDGLVYIAGPPKPGWFTELALDDWEHASRLLALSPVWIARAALKYLKESSSPSMVFVTSVAVKEPIPGLALSNTLRISVHGFVKTLARELGSMGIRVNAVMPGYIMTDRVKELAAKRALEEARSPEEIIEETSKAIPLGRIGSPREVGYVVAFLIGRYSSYVHGASIPVDGGLLESVF